MSQQSRKESQHLSARSILKEKWQIADKIGNGGFGEIYKAKDMDSKRVSHYRLIKVSYLLFKQLTVH